MTKNTKKLLALLDKHYPRDITYLSHETPWQLLVATILSAQCTDARVNTVTERLFAKYPGVDELAEADPDELADDIRSTGLHRGKAAGIIGSMRMLRDTYGGVMPSDIDVLTTFPGVGRKTGNLVIGHVYGIPGIVVDTHVARVSARLGLTKARDPRGIERDLERALPKEHWIRYNTQIIAHGRAVCAARSPKCGACMLAECCAFKSLSDKYTGSPHKLF